MINKIVFPISILLFVLQAAGQSLTTSSDETAIRGLVERINQKKDSIQYTDDRVFVSGPFPRPMIGKMNVQWQAIADSVSKARSNQSAGFTINRLEVAKSGDIAYEFGDFTLSYEELKNQNRRVTTVGSYVRAWKKINGKWLVDVAFMRPNR